MSLVGIVVLSAAFLTSVGVSFSRASEEEKLVDEIRNDGIVWDGNYFGLHAVIEGKSEQSVAIAGAACRPYLFEALNDESRYVAAHVLLTQLEQRYACTAEEWNHLKVVLHADGRVVIPSDQHEKIRSLWTRREREGWGVPALVP